MVDDVKQYYYRNPKQVDSRNLLGNLLQHIPVRLDLDDYNYARYVEDVADGVSRVFGLTSSINRGKVHEQGITLGDKSNEVMISSYEPFKFEGLKVNWRKLTPLRYLYHTRIDTNLPIMNNRTPGLAFGVSVINIPMLAVQYRHWLRHQLGREEGQKESIYRFIGAYVLPNAIDSYLDIAVFNRMARHSLGIGSGTFPTPHPFYLTDMNPRLDKVIAQINDQSTHRSQDLEQLAWATPSILKDNLFGLMEIPGDPVTRHNEWALSIARLPFVKYLVTQTLKAAGTDRSQLNDVLITLVEAKRDSTYSGFTHTDIVKSFQAQNDQLIELLR
jgi:hypothetical protein